MIYYKHFVMNIYYVPTNESNKHLVDSLDDAESKSPYLYPMGEWFKKRDDVIQHKRRFNLTLFFNQGNVDVFIRVEIIHGTYRTQTDLFDDTVNLTIFSPSRFDPDPYHSIYAVIRKEDATSNFLALPYNLITNASFDSIEVDLSSTTASDLGDIYQDASEWDLYHDEMFYEFGYGGTADRNMLIFAWFPYWSSCSNFESRLYINYMLEGGGTDACTIYDPQTPVYYNDLMAEPIADHCNFELTCQYEEPVGIATRKRWWELPVGANLFHLTQEAQPNHKYEDGWTVFSELYGAELRYLPVSISKSSQTPTDQPQIPSEVTFSIFYYQKDANTKILVDTYLEYDGWRDVPVEESTGQLLIDSFLDNGSVLLENGETFDLNYALNINYHAIGYLDILNNLHFDIFPIYIILYLLVGAIIVVFMTSVWVFKRWLSTNTNNTINCLRLTLLYVNPLISGYALSLIPAVMVCCVLYGMYSIQYPFEDATGSYTDIEKLTLTRIEKYRSGRLGYAMLLFGLYFVIQGAMMLIPKQAKNASYNIAWSPTTWKRFWLVMITIIISLFFVYVQQFSYSNYMKNSTLMLVILFKFIHLMIHLLLEESFANSLIVSPFIASMTCIQMIMIITGSKTMLSFLIHFMALYALQFMEAMYFLPLLRRILLLIPVYNAKLQSTIYWNLGQRSESTRYKSYAMDLQDEIDSRSVEPMIENINKTSSEMFGYLIMPPVVYFFTLFYDELRIGELWPTNNNNQYHMIYYLLFMLIICVFICVGNLILFAAQEVYHSWPMYAYFKLAHHRFVTRIKHWKFFEFEFDETLDFKLRELDSLCFSSQFYFMLGITSFGMLFIYLGFTVTLANHYPFISDSFFFILTAFTMFTCMLSRQILIYMFRLSQIWRIRKLPVVHYSVNEDEAPYDPLLHLRSKPVRNKFLEKNKNWLLQNLSKLITPDALQRHRDYLLYHYENIVRQRNDGQLQNKYDISPSASDSDEEEDDPTHAVTLNKRQERVALWWLYRGKRLSEMKRLVDGIIASNTDNTCNECGDDKAALQIHQFISIEDLVYQFDKKVKLGIDRMDKMHPVIAWRKFFKNAQLFRTLCIHCLQDIQIKNINNKNITLISDDSEDDEMNPQGVDFRYQQYQVSFNKISKSIAALWLQAARSSILRQNPPSIPALSISQSDDSSPSSSSNSQMYIARAPVIRDDISSISTSSSSSKHKPQRDDISEDTLSPPSQQVVFYNDDGDVPFQKRYDISSDSESNADGEGQ